MDASVAKLTFPRSVLALASVGVLALAACAPPAPAPTAAPAKPPPTAAPAASAPTTAPPKAEAPPAKPAATAAPAAKPTEKPAAKAAEFDEKAVADFYKGKTIRIVVGYAPGGATDTYARMLQKALPKYVPGNPAVVVENKPGGGSLLAANTVYNAEPRDGTVIGSFATGLALQQAMGVKGAQFDSARYQWLGSSYESFGACAVRSDAGISSVQDVMQGGKELALASYGKGNPSYDPPAVMNAALGTRFKIVTGYEGDAPALLAVKNNEAQGWCGSFESITRQARDLLEGANPFARVLVVTGEKTPEHPLLKGVPAAETLARTEDAKALLRAVHAPFEINIIQAVAPEVPMDRLQALRRGRDKAYADPEFLAAAEKSQLAVSPKTGEEMTRIVQRMLGTPPAMLAKLREILE